MRGKIHINSKHSVTEQFGHTDIKYGSMPMYQFILYNVSKYR